MRRYICPFSYCGRPCWTAWGIKRHVKGHMDDLHRRMDSAATTSPGGNDDE